MGLKMFEDSCKIYKKKAVNKQPPTIVYQIKEKERLWKKNY